MLISHSQDFLNGICTNIIHMHNRKLKYYTVSKLVGPQSGGVLQASPMPNGDLMAPKGLSVPLSFPIFPPLGEL